MKSKFLTVFVLFASLALTACGGSSQGKTSSRHVHTAAENAPWQMDDSNHWKDCQDNDGGKVDNKAHTWVSDPANANKDREATCQQTGLVNEKCSVCGKTRERQIPKTEHNYTEWAETTNSTVCEKEEERHCQNPGCTEKQVRRDIISAHEWTVTKTNTKIGDTDMDYEEVECSKCGAVGLWVAAKEMTVVGTRKSSGPDDCVKLENNGDNLTGIINVEEAKVGRIYLHAACGHWHDGSTNNNTRGFYVNGAPNFKLEINEEEVDFSSKEDLTYDELLAVSEEHDSSNYSEIGDAEVGACALKVGLNTIKYTRLDSYNLTVQKFLIVFDN